jgi:hypothetical protein
VRAAVLLAVGLAACSGDDGVTIDPLPVPVDFSTGAPVALLRTPALDDTLRPVVVDTGSPLSFVDAPRGTLPLARVSTTVEVFRATPPVPRARLEESALLLGPSGGAPDGSAVAGVLGGDLLGRLAAVRFDPANAELRFLPNLAGSSSDRENDCEAVFFTGRRGGGSFQLSPGVTYGYPATRMVVHTCLAPRDPSCDATLPLECTGGTATPTDTCATPRADSLLVVATGAGPSVLSRSAYLRATGLGEADLDALPTAPLYLPGRQIQGELHPVGSLPGVALVGDEQDDVGACCELACARYCEVHPPPDAACLACTGDADDIAASGIELGGSIPVAILPDSHPLLQALRDELRPAIGDVDGLLGMSALMPLVTGIDYGKGWVVGHCNDPADPTCLVRPRVTDAERRLELTTLGCLPSR